MIYINDNGVKGLCCHKMSLNSESIHLCNIKHEECLSIPVASIYWHKFLQPQAHSHNTRPVLSVCGQCLPNVHTSDLRPSEAGGPLQSSQPIQFSCTQMVERTH